MSNIINSGAYLRTTRDFPEDAQALRMELNKAYIDTSNAINARTTGLYPTNRPAINGEEWFLSGLKQQGLRQVFPFTSTGNISHGIDLDQIFGFTHIYGTFTDGSDWYPLPYVDVTAANNQVNVVVDGANIIITAGGGSPPTITQGYVILEWLSQT